MLEHQTEDKQNKNKRTLKRNTLVLTDEIKSQVSDSLRQILSEVKDGKQKKMAEVLIRENLEFIDELSKTGATMNQIFERINKIVKLGISPNSFSVYVRRIKQKFQCEFCEKESVLIDTSEFSDLKTKIWVCKKCSTMYKNKKNTLTVERISKKAEEKIRHDFAIHDK